MRRSSKHFPSLCLALLVGSLCPACERVRTLTTGAESEAEKARRDAAAQTQREQEATREMALREKNAAQAEAERERRELGETVLAAVQQVIKVHARMDREARDAKNASDARARVLTEAQYSALQAIPLQDCPDDFAAAMQDFFHSVRAFSEYSYTQNAAEIEYVLEILSKGPEAARLASKNLKPGPQKLIQRYVAMTELAGHYGVTIDEKGARLSAPAP
jgi:hypothetical protein